MFLKEWDINIELVRKHFLFQNLVALLKKLKKIRNNPEKNKIQVNLILSGFIDFKEEIEDMSKEEKKIEI